MSRQIHRQDVRAATMKRCRRLRKTRDGSIACWRSESSGRFTAVFLLKTKQAIKNRLLGVVIT